MKTADTLPDVFEELDLALENLIQPSPEAKKPVRSKDEVKRVKRKISQLAKVWAELDLDVLPGAWWSCGFKESSKITPIVDDFIKGKKDSIDELTDTDLTPEQILYPEEKLYEESEDEIDGKINHEGGHALHTDFRNLFISQRRAREEGYLPTTAASILNAVEDCRVNTLQIGISDHRRRKFEATYQGWIEHHRSRMKSMPVTSAVGTLIISKWVQEHLGIIDQKTFSEMYQDAPADAQKGFDQLINASREYYNTSDRKRANTIFHEKIWPIYRELEKKAIDNQKVDDVVRDLLKELIKQQTPADPNQPQPRKPSPIDKLPPRIREAIIDQLSKMSGGEGQSDVEQNPEKKNQESGQDQGQKEGQEGGNKSQKNKQPSQKGSKGENSEQESSGSESGSEAGNEDDSSQSKSKDGQKGDKESQGNKQPGQKGAKGEQGSPGSETGDEAGKEDSSTPSIDSQQGGNKAPGKKQPSQKGSRSENSEQVSSGPESGSESQNSNQTGKKEAKGEETPDDIKQKTKQAIRDTLEQNQPEEQPQVSDDLKKKILEALDQNCTNEEKEKLAKQARAEVDEKQAQDLNEDGLPAGQKMEKDTETGEYQSKIEPPTEQEIDQAQKEVQEIDQKAKEIADAKKKFQDQIDQAQKPADIDKIMQEKMDDEVRQEIEKKAQAKKELLQKQREQKINQMKKEGFLDKDQFEAGDQDEKLYDLYKSYEQAVKRKVDYFVEHMLPHIPKKATVEYGDRRVRSGTELDPEILGDFGTRQQGLIFKSPEIVERGDPRIMITFVVDRSGSMAGKKIAESMKTLIFFALCLKKIGETIGRPLDFSIKFFDDKVSEAKNFEDDYESAARREWSDGTKNTVKKRLMVESLKSGGTDMGAAIVSANSDLNKRRKQFPDYMSCLFVISDGDTFGALQGEKLTRFIQSLEEYEGQKMGKHLKIGFFLRGGTGLSEEQKKQPTPMEQYFGERGKGTVVVDDFNELVPEAAKVLKKALIKMAEKLFR